MKFIFLLGGTAGFITAAGTDFLAGRNPDRVLFDGAVGCLAGAVLLRWFWNVLLGGMRETYVARQKAAVAAIAAANGSEGSSPAGAHPNSNRPRETAPAQPARAPAAGAASGPRPGPAAAAAPAAGVKNRS